MNYEGLKDDIIDMLAGGRCSVDPTGFQNDMSDIRSKDDVFTVLIHLGYLSYDWRENECYIPNREVAGEMVKIIDADITPDAVHLVIRSILPKLPSMSTTSCWLASIMIATPSSIPVA